jgi:hypothetical protein
VENSASRGMDLQLGLPCLCPLVICEAATWARRSSQGHWNPLVHGLLFGDSLIQHALLMKAPKRDVGGFARRGAQFRLNPIPELAIL